MNALIKQLKALTTLILLVAISACAPMYEAEEACQFVQNSYGQRVSWNGKLPVKFYVHESVPAEFDEAIVAAMKHWDEALGSRPLFEFAGRVSHGSKAVKDGANIIYLRDTWDTENNNEQARTTMFWKGTQIQEADIQLNGEDFDFFSNQPQHLGAIDMVSLMVHEFGHALGLTHSTVTKSVMASRLAASTLRREPSKEDMDALRCEY